MYARVFEKSPIGLPYRLSTRSGVGIALSEPEGALLQAVAAEIGAGADAADGSACRACAHIEMLSGIVAMNGGERLPVAF